MVDPSDEPEKYDKATFEHTQDNGDYDTDDDDDLSPAKQAAYDEETKRREEKRQEASDDPPKEEPGMFAQIRSFFSGNGSVRDVCT